MTQPQEVDIGPLPAPSEQDTNWAWRLWNTLQKADEQENKAGGVWDMPNVGRYRRTGDTQLTLTEIHGDMLPDRAGVSLWHKHDWIRLLADKIGWFVVNDGVLLADNNPLPSEEDEPRLEHIGKVWACPCGMVYTLLSDSTQELRIKVAESGDCLNPTCDIIIPHPHAGVLNVVNDTAVLAKMEANNLIKVAQDEDEYPIPPMEPPITEMDLPSTDDEEE